MKTTTGKNESSPDRQLQVCRSCKGRFARIDGSYGCPFCEADYSPATHFVFESLDRIAHSVFSCPMCGAEMDHLPFYEFCSRYCLEEAEAELDKFGY